MPASAITLLLARPSPAAGGDGATHGTSLREKSFMMERAL
jgi:hypothetical protein